MSIRITERKYWRNGYTIHGGYFKQYAFTIVCLGFIVANGRPWFTLYLLK